MLHISFPTRSVSPGSNFWCNDVANIIRRWSRNVHHSRSFGRHHSPIQWKARKLRRVARSGSTGELLSASVEFSTLMYRNHLLSELTYFHQDTMLIDSRSSMNLATTIKELTEAMNKIYLSLFRENFSPKSMANFGWVSGHYYIAYFMTTDNRNYATLLLRALQDDTFSAHPDTIIRCGERSFLCTIFGNVPKKLSMMTQALLSRDILRNLLISYARAPIIYHLLWMNKRIKSSVRLRRYFPFVESSEVSKEPLMSSNRQFYVWSWLDNLLHWEMVWFKRGVCGSYTYIVF